MLQNIRDNAQGTVAKIIVFLIILTFAIFGTDAIIQSFYGEPEVAQVNGEAISQADFERMLERKRRQLISQMGDKFDPSLIDQNRLRKMTLDESVQRTVVRQAAEKNGLVASEAQVDAFIMQWPPAQRDGKFDPDQYRMVLANIGMTPIEFRHELKLELAMGQLQGGVSQSAFVTEAELKDLLRLERQTRDFRFQTLNASDLVASIDVSDDDVQSYYDEHKEDYRLPDRLVVEYLHVKKSDLEAAVAVAEADVENQYQTELAAFQSSEQRRASHILLELKDGQTEEAVKAKLSALREEILAGKAFSDVAKRNSEDLGTAADGGSLGLLAKGAMGDDAFDNALFSMQEGDVSEPVKTQFGYHLIRLDGISATQPPTKEEAFARIRQELTAQKAEARLVEMSTQLTDLTYSAADLQEAANELKLSIQDSPAFSRDGVSGDSLWSNPRVLEQAWSEDVTDEGHNSELIEIGQDQLLVLRKKELLESAIQPLDDVKSAVRNTVALARAKDQVRQQVAEIEAQKPESIVGDKWVSQTVVNRTTTENQAIVDYAFSMPAPTDGVPVLKTFETDEGFVVVLLDKVQDPSVDDMQKQLDAIRPLLANRVGATESGLYFSALQSQAEIVRNP